MTKRKTSLLLSSILIILAISNLGGRVIGLSHQRLDPKRIDGSGMAYIPPVNEAINTMQRRIEHNPKDAVSYTLLGDLYIRQARESGDVSAYQRAETALHRSLELLPGYAPSGSLLASVYYSQHEFAKALALAESVYSSNPKLAQAQIIIADCQLALGNYQAAGKIYRELADTNATPPLLARLANLEELMGNSGQALALMQNAAKEVLASGGSRENAAWYLLRVGDIDYNMGRLDDAGAFYEAALRVFNDYHLALAGLGKVRAAQGKYVEAIAYYEHAVSIIPQPDFLAALGDLYQVTGQPDKAQLQYKTVEYIGKLATLNRQIYNRQLANFYSDHDLNVKEALKLALAELDSRKDVYGYDAAAWAYYKNGDFKQAQAMMNFALSLGTRDARLYYHAGMIAFRLGNELAARRFLSEALAINPSFSVLQAGEARRTLETLQPRKTQ